LSDEDMDLLTRAPVKSKPALVTRRDILLKKVREEDGEEGIFSSTCPERLVFV
jgi:hypothetical protein